MRLHQLHLLGVCFGLALTACPPGKGETSATDASTSASGGGSSGEATAAATESATGGATSAGETTGGGGSETSGAASSGPATSGSETTGGGSETATSGVGTTTTGPQTTGPDTTGGGEPGECAGPADCKLHSDCCSCEGVPLEDMTPACLMECKQAKCSEYGVDAVECRFGVCRTERLSCDANKVACDALPPPCPDGFLAETTPVCWTGKCVPAALCDVVPDCALCPDGTVCVQDVAFGPQGWPRCEPVPAACNGKASCACMGDLVCTGEFTFCSMGDQGLSCECPNC